MKKLTLSLFLLILASLAIVPVLAEEAASGHYMPGALADCVDALPLKPGFTFVNIFSAYNGDTGVGREIPIIGTVGLNVEGTAFADCLLLLYTFKPKVLGGQCAALVSLPLAHLTIDADLVTPTGTVHRSQSASGLGDIFFSPFAIGWKVKDCNIGAIMGFYAPTGKYERTNVANLGKNYWTVEPTFYVSYMGHKNMVELSLFTGVDFNTTNNETDYKTGTQWHVEGTVAKHWMTKSHAIWGIGANVYYYQQITGDSGTGAKLGDFKGRSFGVGPALSFIKHTKKALIAAEVKWLPELSVENRLKGNSFFGKLAFVF
ncbi:MAG: transporter [Acidobacteria bacterium]|nr:transporter [Acidobacteriota bacterium]